MPCCRCNRSGRCRNCACVKANKPCSSCLPKRLGGCLNDDTTSTPGTSATSSQHQPGPSNISQPSSAPDASAVSTSSTELPSFACIFSAKQPTLQHVPKGARDAWANVLNDALVSICQDPSNDLPWRKFFMLPRCILLSPVRGGRTH